MLSTLLEKIRSQETPAAADGQVAHLAAATLFMEVAWADHDISAKELVEMRRALKAQFDLDDADVDSIIEESRAHHDDSVGLYSFTRTINDVWTEQQKYALVEALWRVAFADDNLNKFEEHMIRRIAELLYISHRRFIEAKQAARG